ncbi:RnfABCDGE type electron transport complex subunit B [Emergencia sp. 1XD21-10]|uniref:RnfABCDGE type electron transport complex subunit B n=1 Tax=Emergencia sp. 1XD21-10 TaxID=2304569 RepID=UPI0013794C9D|nr:RnfABCDGE type electron transport complex subunit B [Emergencia sp. 1XD21-10]NCE97838.1 RnfABCDGE type electron transport complex subunit B [Emergencia sp. 1XD21-10]
MNMSEIVIAVVSLCVISAIIGIALSIAEKVFHVEVNELEVAVREVLPGSNCGGCGYAGCDALAKAIAEGSAPVTACPVGGKSVAEEIARIMGQEVGDMEKMVAYVRCNGTSDMKQVDYQYIGIESCAYAAKMPGSSPYACKYGCLGYGSCAKVCPERAIRIIDKKAVVDEALCIACGKCIKVCPHDLIELVPAASTHRVQCVSLAKGKEVMNACKAGCIGCGLCAKNCPSDAIVMENNIARIDYSKCTHCGACAEKCPRRIIKVFE